MQNHGFNLGDDEHVCIDIVCSMFDGKMAAIMLVQEALAVNYARLHKMNSRIEI